jgi:hypothetical protein
MACASKNSNPLNPDSTYRTKGNKMKLFSLILISLLATASTATAIDKTLTAAKLRAIHDAAYDSCDDSDESHAPGDCLDYADSCVDRAIAAGVDVTCE